MRHHIGRRQRAILEYVFEQHLRGRAPGSINEVACHDAERKWHQTSNSEAARTLERHGLLRVDPHHPDAHPRGRGAVLLTTAGLDEMRHRPTHERLSVDALIRTLERVA